MASRKKVTETQPSAMKVEPAPAASKKMAAVAKHTPATKRHPQPAEPAVAAREAPAASTQPAVQVTAEEIARVAYSYSEARGFAPGAELEDWLRAEGALRARAAAG